MFGTALPVIVIFGTRQIRRYGHARTREKPIVVIRVAGEGSGGDGVGCWGRRVPANSDGTRERRRRSINRRKLQANVTRQSCRKIKTNYKRIGFIYSNRKRHLLDRHRNVSFFLHKADFRKNQIIFTWNNRRYVILEKPNFRHCYCPRNGLKAIEKGVSNPIHFSRLLSGTYETDLYQKYVLLQTPHSR